MNSLRASTVRRLLRSASSRPFSSSTVRPQRSQTKPATSIPSTTTVSSATGSRIFAAVQSSPLGRAIIWYGEKQKKRPYWTQFWSTVVIFLLSDFSAQLLVPWITDDQEEEKSVWDRYDPVRTLRHVSIGGFVAIPSYTWFMFVHNHFNYTSKFLSIFTKVALSQLIYAPIFNVYFFSAQSLLAGGSVEETIERLKKTLPVSIVNSAKIWPAISAFMFIYIDPQFRAIFAGTIALGWQTYLSWLNQMAARDVMEKKVKEDEVKKVGMLQA
ncbi:hypothetical protein FQN49_003461 [Arthroderma sp. PD_2]|nr:hypothetical protein FQN49_003461 [Arthroderma sp. PD_2]